MQLSLLFPQTWNPHSLIKINSALGFLYNYSYQLFIQTKAPGYYYYYYYFEDKSKNLAHIKLDRRKVKRKTPNSGYNRLVYFD